jgi:tetratricopeptide (TPR) repeat protein
VDIEQALQIYSEQIKQNPSHSEYFFFYGTVMGLRARIQLAEKNYFGVLTSGYNAIRFIKKTEKLYPDQPDFQLPVGLFNYYVSISAPYMKIASRLMRESGSRSEGLQAIKAAADYGNYGRYEARSLLAYLYFYFESNYDGAYEYARKMAEDFPKNPYYAAQTADAAIQIGQLDQANYYLKRIEALLPTQPPRTQKDYQGILRLLYGSLALAQGRLDEAESNLIEFIKSYDYELDYDLGNALVRLGNVYDLQKRRSEAIACYRKAVQLNNRTAAVSLAEQYLKRPYIRS